MVFATNIIGRDKIKFIIFSNETFKDLIHLKDFILLFLFWKAKLPNCQIFCNGLNTMSPHYST